MSTWYDAYWPALKAVVTATWPEIPNGQLFSDVNIERRDWTNLLDSQQIVGPWVIVTVDVVSSDDGPVNFPGYDVTPTVYYIAPHAQGVTATLISKLEALKAALLTAQTLGTVWQDKFTLSINAENVVNRALLEADQQFQAGSLQFTSLVVVVDS